MKLLRLIPICLALILILCGCGGEVTPTETPAPPVAVAILTSTPTPTATATPTPTPRLDLTETAQSWTATPTFTPTPLGRWGIYAESDLDLEIWQSDWLRVIPAAWLNADEASARFRLELEEYVHIVERCEYQSNREVVRQQVNFEAALTDLESDDFLDRLRLPGEEPHECGTVVTFPSDRMVLYRTGDLPDRAEFEAWFFRTLPGDSPGLVTLTPTPTPTLEPTPIPLSAEQAARDTLARNSAWEPHQEMFDGVAMMEVPAGCFTMGSWITTDTQPPHIVCLDSFWIDRIEVTNAQFAAFDGQAEETSVQSDPQWPRERITWAEASQFCASRGGRLPTEAEWEYAARGPESWLYPWGDEFVPENLIYGRDRPYASGGLDTTTASWVGALDMVGNVEEWVADWFGPYSPEPQINPTGPQSGTLRIRRGGSWTSDGWFFVNGAIRPQSEPDVRSWDLGFRCVRPAGD